jgi:polyketide biosynthesis 3-hydroxy-3-methylglutaryl-CoA synthase-like enzyme PksG
MQEYEALLIASSALKFGTRNVKLERPATAGSASRTDGRKLLFLSEIHEYHRNYEWA